METSGSRTGGQLDVTMAALVGLTAPLQFTTSGVTVYSQLPAGTDVSVQVVVVTTPAQPLLTVAGLPLTVLYLATA
jgi:hypothetical protein